MKTTDNDRLPITLDLLRAGASPSGHWTATQLALLGVAEEGPPRPDWKDRLLGRLVHRDAALQFVRLREE